jgi:DNA (cytosine-5)-methyltransferase 1
MGDKPQGLDKVTGKYVYGGQVASNIDEARDAMGINWAIWSELVEAIPPAFTKYLGDQIVNWL